MSFLAAQWSDVHRRWFFMPRKLSYEPYNDKLDSMRCTNYLIIADEYFTNFKYIKVGKLEITRGFSAFQFIPGSDIGSIFY
jgi:soluble calcium-activated nucleotidase 1